jgi:plastocyanin
LTQRDKFALALIVVLVALVARLPAQGVNVTGRVTYFGPESPPSGISAVVWLVPITSPDIDPPAVKPVEAVLRQKNKAFEPHLLVVTKGSTVQFPNLDPWFHNVFSLFNGKKFDLGLYEAGTTRTVHFDRQGVSYIFCNIHPEMSAVVVVVSSPYYGAATKSGDFAIVGVPPGRYTLHVWAENSLPETLEGLSREVELNGTMRSMGTLRVREAEVAKQQHKNKYGQDYEPPSPSNPVYTQP